MTLKVTIHKDGRLTVEQDGLAPAVVQPKRCFPWTESDRYISLRDDQHNEVAFIHDVKNLDPESRNAVMEGLNKTAFIFHIKSIINVKPEFEIRSWHVITEHGAYKFQTKLDDWPVKLRDGGYLIRDITGNLFRIDDVALLDNTTKKLLWAFID
jgi:hypothetical protein